MNSHITYRQLIGALAANDEPYAPVDLGNDFSLIVTQRGGRVFGPFWREGESLTWINPALASAESFARFRREGQWNMGGERLWIAPEIQYNIKDRADFWGSHHVPAAMDPGQYRLGAGDRSARLSTEMTLQAYNLSQGEVRLRVEQSISRLGLLPSMTAEAVIGAHYLRKIELSPHPVSGPVSQSWVLTQLNAGGELFILGHPDMKAATYFGDPTLQALTPQGKVFRIAITGQRQFKTGYSAASPRGQIGYINALDDGQSYLLVRYFVIHPDGLYAEEIPDQPGANGHAIHVYNDGGQFGANGEMEASGDAIGGSTGRSITLDHFGMLVYLGPTDALYALVERIFGLSS